MEGMRAQTQANVQRVRHLQSLPAEAYPTDRTVFEEYVCENQEIEEKLL
jgi:hypothetical protein